MNLPGITDLVAGVFKPAADLIDNLHTSEEEKLQAKARLMEAQASAIDQAFKYESKALQAKADIVRAEASSDHTLAAIWRPITMLVFLALAVADSLGIVAKLSGSPLASEAWVLLQVGLGGYVVSRSVEKVAKIRNTAKAID